MNSTVLWGAIGALSFALVTTADAAPLPPGWTTNGVAGVGSPNGVVTAPPAYGPNYYYVTTAGAPPGNGTLASANLNNETNGSTLTSPTFTADANDVLQFYFNYVTSDGSSFADYAWATLNDAVTKNQVAVLFTARTRPTGDIVPGFGLPAAAATFAPPTTAIIPGGPAWEELGASSGACYNGVGQGCGYTGWIQSNYTILASGTYQLLFGVTNWGDTAYHSGMAIAGATIAGTPIDPPVIPLPATVWLLGAGLMGFAGLRRSKRPAA